MLFQICKEKGRERKGSDRKEKCFFLKFKKNTVTKQKMEEDFTIGNYTLEELLDLLGLDAKATREAVSHAVHDKVRRFAANPAKAYFFQEAERVVLASREFAPPTGTVMRILNVDSFYRETLDADNLGSDSFTFTLSERVNNVKALTLLSVEIPQTWYAFSAAKGNTAFLVQGFDGVTPFTAEATIPDGNYTNGPLLAAVEKAVNAVLSGTALYSSGAIGAGPWVGLTQESVNGKATLKLLPPYFPDALKITWFDPNFAYASMAAAKLNFNLGWAVGFRFPSTSLNADEPTGPVLEAVAPSLVSTGRTRYLVLKIDDHTANRLTQGMLSVGQTDRQVRLPDYRTLAATYRRGSTTEVNSQPSGPRRLTLSQLHTLNAISAAGGPQRLRAAVSDTDTFAKIPIKHVAEWQCDGVNDVTVEMAGMLQKNRRAYFGPVTLTTLTVSLYDDAGNLLGLNGHDWSCTLEIESSA